MASLIEYIEAHGHETMAQRPFSEVDNLLLSRLAYGHYDAAGFECPGVLKAIYPLIMPRFFKLDAPLLEKTALSERFQDTVSVAYMDELEPEMEKQFAAVTYLLPDGTAYVAFRGTDSTLIGWKEDLNLTFLTPIPAQLEAVEYLNQVGRMLACPLRVGGHSKGGNLAVYASSFCDRAVQDRIIAVYNNDGPGQVRATLLSEGYIRIRPRLQTYLPQSSIIGMLLEHDDDYTVVRAEGWGIFQHYPYNWQIEGTRFDTEPNVTKSSACMSESIRCWLADMDNERRKLFIDKLFEVLSSEDAKTLHDLTDSWDNLPGFMAAAREIPQEDRQVMYEILKHFLRIAYRQYAGLIQDEIKEFAASARAMTKLFREENLRDAASKRADKKDADTLRARFLNFLTKNDPEHKGA